jgi:hypothetical protein
MRGLKGAAQQQAANAQVATNGGRLANISKKQLHEDRRWEFSFRFYQQFKNFGFDGDKIEPVFFVSLMERLAQLGKKTVDECISDRSTASSFRIHPIDWKRKNVPIARNDLTWVEKIYLSDEENYPMRQFSISTSLGRVVGFFDENWTFQIVLLDPLHNIQPSKDFDYAVDPCDPLDCEITQLRAAIEAVLHKAPACECNVAKQVLSSLERKTRAYLPTILLTPIADDILKDVSDAMDITGQSYSEIFSAGIYSILGKD